MSLWTPEEENGDIHEGLYLVFFFVILDECYYGFAFLWS